MLILIKAAANLGFVCRCLMAISASNPMAIMNREKIRPTQNSCGDGAVDVSTAVMNHNPTEAAVMPPKAPEKRAIGIVPPPHRVISNTFTIILTD